MKRRTDIIEAMHTIMLNMNDERAYDEWIRIVPDEPSDEDIDYISESKELREDAWQAFIEAIEEYGEHGVYWA